MSAPIILVVEDDKTGQYVLKQLLEKFDFDCHVVGSGEKALAALATTNYACVLMDIRLTGMNGFECTKKIRETESRTKRHTPVVALTGMDEDLQRVKAQEAGMDDFLAKPFDAEDLRKILLRYVYDPRYPNLKVLNPVRKKKTSDG